jgi:arylsulfatase A-like enzyme
LFLTAAVLSQVVACAPETSGPARQRPNILLISVDTLRADHLSSDGYARVTSPFLDSLASQGVRFERAYATSSWTTPSVVSMLTSTYQNRHRMGARFRGIPTRWSRIPDELPSLAESLQRSGYRTFGLVANANLPADRGFDRGFDRFTCLGTADLDVVDRTITPWLDEIGAGEGPWFLWLHMLDPHAPYKGRNPWIESFDADYARFRWLDRMPSEVFATRAQKLHPRHLELIRALYDSEIRATDEFLRRLFDRLDGAHDAFVLFTSDHGEEFLDHGGTLHGRTLFEESIRVPFIVRLPDRRLSGTVVQDPVSLVDVLPTILGAAGIEPGEHTAGIDLIGSNGIATSPDRVVVAELLRGYAERAVTDGRWKLIHREGNPQRTELYDLREDPGERTNLAAAHPEQVSRFLELLAVFEQRNSPVSATPGQVEISPEELEALRALGYVGTE